MLGPLFVDIAGTELSAEDRELLTHPLVGGVIFFSRNFDSPEQIASLTREIKSLRTPSLLIAVDHEGGRVQRFKTGFTHLPAVSTIGHVYDQDRNQALNFAYQHGWLMAAELRAVGIDFSFAPVLDLDYSRSEVIGDRAFHHEAIVVAEIAHHYIQGMHAAGMQATGKHFPGHGWAVEDSHVAIPTDERSKDAIYEKDIIPYKLLLNKDLAAIMPAHVIYSEIDTLPACFSRIWLRDILRQELGYGGLIISDDLTMEGASIVAATIPERTTASLEAGCDMVLICNNRQAVVDTIDAGRVEIPVEAQERIEGLRGTGEIQFDELHANTLWQRSNEIITEYAN
jgi:beta-N-acetylhexosaminidase